MLKIIQPLLLSVVIMYFNNGIQKKKAFVYALALSICALISCFLSHLYFFNVWRIGMKIRLAVSGLIYRKVNLSLFNYKIQLNKTIFPIRYSN